MLFKPHRHKAPVYSEEDRGQIIAACVSAVLNDPSLWNEREMKQSQGKIKAYGVKFEKTLARQVLEHCGYTLDNLTK